MNPNKPEKYIAVPSERRLLKCSDAKLREFSENLSLPAIDIDHNKIDKNYFVKKALQLLTNPNRTYNCASLEWRICLLRSLEKITKSEFRNTKDMKNKINSYLGSYDLRKRDISLRIVKAREKIKITQKQLADQVGYKSHVSIAHFEKGSRYPTKRVLQWLEEIGM